MPNHEVSRHLGPGRRNVRGAGERKREGFRSLLGQNSGKKYFLGKHFRCSDRRKPLLCKFSTLVPGGAADKATSALGAGRPVVPSSGPRASCTRNSKATSALGAGRPVVPRFGPRASCTRNSKALKKIFSAPSAQKVKNFLRASREKEISFLGGGESLEVLVIFCFFFGFCFECKFKIFSALCGKADPNYQNFE